jgi:adenylylsulfate kinase-like enzyme
LTDLCRPLHANCFVREHRLSVWDSLKKDRETNIRCIGYVASEIVRHVGVAVYAAISPYRATYNDVRNMVGKDHYVDVFMDTSVEANEQGA